ncbi:MAG: hypothetical protein IIB60_05910 [Planctomycetes bacterium]|nr:hypothetical protein [Planctomycetota bacterium]
MKGWEDCVLGSASPPWFALETMSDKGSVKCFKTGHLRSVWRVSVGTQRVYAKVFTGGGFVGWVKRRLRGTPAQREWHNLREAVLRGVPTVKPVAVGVSACDGHVAVLLTEEMVGATPLPDVWDRNVTGASQACRPKAVAGIIDAVARMLADAHRRGFAHRDGHPHNILLYPAEEDRLKAVYVDALEAVLVKGSVRENGTVRSLAQLDQFFQDRATRAERRRFLRSYTNHRQPDGGTLPAGPNERFLIAGIIRARELGAQRLARHRDRRLRRNGKYFGYIRLDGGWRGMVVLRLARRHRFPEPGVPDRTPEAWRRILTPVIEARGASDFHQDSHQEVGGPGGFHLKFTRISGIGAGLISRLISTFLGSPARRAFERSHRKRHRDQPAELVLGYLDHWTAGLVDETILITPAQTAELYT